MAVEYKTSNTKADLLEIAAANGIKADESMTKTQIIAALDAYNAKIEAEPTATTVDTTEETNTTQSGAVDAEQDSDNGSTQQDAQSDAVNPEIPKTTKDTNEEENKNQSGVTGENDEYDMFAYVGPSLPRGQLKENAVFRGKIKDVLNYLADVLEEYPQVAKLIVPTHKLAVYSAKVKTPGNVANKYYTDIVSAMHGNKEV